MKFNYLLSLALLLSTSTTVLAKECADSQTCAIFSNAKGEIVHRVGKQDATLLKGDSNGAASYTTYVSKRNGKYYLVRESSTSDHNIVIVPIDLHGQTATFKRILFLSINLMKSTKSGREIWSGSEYNLKNPSRFDQFSWDKAYEWQGQLTASTLKSHESTNAPDGFSVAQVAIYREDGKMEGQRTLLYQTRIGLNPDSIICYTNCDFTVGMLDGDFIGAIGKYPIHVFTSQKDGKISGYYSYDGKPGQLYLSGFTEYNKITVLTEHETEEKSNLTGEFEISQFQPYIAGTWKSKRNSTKLPVVLFPDALYQ
ncbi:hypothetical protein KDW36_05370 [Burkholderia dolosa]|uniref:hypothetical protein n=1 Tax=Burkholderia dolosa TaxID=152500 RepID=UPI001B972F36|nr:hypothetical protein [Burkholderia dolosa]MBR8312624.1 hypothetical protein [Burkholderia dolosa]